MTERHNINGHESHIIETMNRPSYTGTEIETRTLDVLFEREEGMGDEGRWINDEAFDDVFAAIADSSRVSGVQPIKQ